MFEKLFKCQMYIEAINCHLIILICQGLLKLKAFSDLALCITLLILLPLNLKAGVPLWLYYCFT